VLGVRSPWRLDFVRWRFISVGPPNVTRSMSPFEWLQFWDGSQIFERKKFCTPWIMHKCGQQIDFWQTSGFWAGWWYSDTQMQQITWLGSLHTWLIVHSPEYLHVDKNVILKGIIKILSNKLSHIYLTGFVLLPVAVCMRGPRRVGNSLSSWLTTGV
jgi:hypothetical protein